MPYRLRMGSTLQLQLLVKSMKHLIIIGVFLLIACSTINAQEIDKNETSDFFIILSNLLNINHDRHSYIDDNGVKQIDSLKSFKEFERVYSKYIEPDKKDKKFSQKQLKLVMLLAFYADQHNAAAFQEYLASDLVPIYTNNSELFLTILKELPFLVPSVCNRLNAYFGFEGKNAEKKPAFLSKNNIKFEKYLPKNQKLNCLDSFK